MPKSSSPDLFRLVKAMTKAEKAYFSFKALRIDNDDHQFIQMFKLIELQTTYNESSIARTLKISKGQMARTKHYLYESLIDAIVNLNKANEPVSEIRHLLNQTDVLFQKRLFKSCEKKLAKALAIAEQAELFTYVAEIMATLMQLKEIQNDTSWLLTDGKKYFQHQEKNLKDLKTLQQLQDYKYHKLAPLHELFGNSTALTAKYGDGSLLIKDIKGLELAATSKTAKLLYYNYLCFVKYVFGQTKDAVTITKKTISLFNNDLVFTRKNSRYYLHTINNYLLIGQPFLKAAEVDSMLALLKQCATDFERDDYVKTNALARYYHFYLLSCFNFKKIDILPTVLEEACNWLATYNEELIDQVNYSKGIEFLIASGYFKLGNYEKALEYSQKIINLKLLNYDYHITRINFLILQFELGNYQVLNNLIVSIERHYKSDYTFKAIALCICKYLRNWNLQAINKIKKEIFSNILAEMKTISREPITAKQISQFEHHSALIFEHWCEGKIGNKGK